MEIEDFIYQSDSDSFLDTTDDFHDDGQLKPDDSLIALNLALKEVEIKENVSNLYINLACLSDCLFVFNKRQNG